MSLTNLTTYENAADAINLERGVDQRYVERLIRRATADMERICSRRFARADGIVEKVAAIGPERLYVSRPPIRSVSRIEFVDEVVDAEDYDWETRATSGVIQFDTPLIRRSFVLDRISGRVDSGTELPDYTITYDGGFMTAAQDAADDPDDAAADLPVDIEEVCCDVVVHYYRQRGLDRGIRSRGLAESSVSFEERTGGLPKTLYDQIIRFKRTVLR